MHPGWLSGPASGMLRASISFFGHASCRAHDIKVNACMDSFSAVRPRRPHDIIRLR